MKTSDHERAREMIALDGAEDRAQHRAEDRSGPQSWLRGHLQECAACRDYAEAAGRVVRALHSQPLSMESQLESEFESGLGSELVQATQMRLRLRAIELRQQQERLRLVCLSCVLVGLTAAVTTPLLWRAFAWIGAWAGVSNPVWQAGFACFDIVPALFTGAVLLARGTHLINNAVGQWK